MINEVECTIITDTKKTLPTDFWPSDWWGTLKNSLINGGLWKLHKITTTGLFRMFSPINGKTGPMMIVFNHEDGPRYSYAYQKRFGFHGQRLVELLGTGFNPYREDIIKQPVLTVFLTPPIPPYSWRTYNRNPS
ncbi:hypothetical protein M0802_001149 [Mischocyttarus mexicanus]|nr:hypothetical protein M0802_001149 [Mischocyttarus mexicanus]